MDIDCILFDLDGTLVDTNADLTVAMNYTLKQFNEPPIQPKQLEVLLGCGIHDLTTKAFRTVGRELNAEELEKAVQINLEYYNEHTADLSKPFPGVIELLKSFREKNIKMAVVTNKSTTPSKKIIEAAGLTEYMLLVQGDGDNLLLKPNADLLLYAMKKINAVPEKTLMVGDNFTDIGAARNAGVKSVFIKNGYGVIGDEKADYVIDDFADLGNIGI